MRRSVRRSRIVPACTLVLALLLGGCASGLLYTRTTFPLDTDFADTPSRIDREAPPEPSEGWKTITIPVGFWLGADLSIDWGDASIARALEEAGIETVHYADVETFSVLLVWTERRVRVYGE